MSRQPENLRSHLSFLYGINTLGAVFGALLAGFFLLRVYAVSTTLYVAVATNVLIGVVSLLLQEKVAGGFADRVSTGATSQSPLVPVEPAAALPEEELGRLPLALVFWGIGISGFCALGYEVFWTRILTIAVGASVYGFTIILVAFLTGIAWAARPTERW